MAMSEEKGFFSSLFDLSFDEFITMRIVRVLFILGIIGSGILALSFIISGFAGDNPAMGILFLLLSPVVFFLYVIMVRVWLEIVLVIFKIAENTNQLVKKDKSE